MTGKEKIFISFLLFVCFILDGVLAALFSVHFYEGTGAMVPRLVVLSLIVLSFYFPFKQLVFYSIVLGLLYDSYYTGVLGIYVALFPLISYVTDRLKELLNPNAVVAFMVTVINLSIMETYLYFAYKLLGYTTIGTELFLADRLGPTLLMNLSLFIVMYYPLKKIIVAVAEE